MTEMYELVCENRRPIKEDNMYLVTSMFTGEVTPVNKQWIHENKYKIINIKDKNNKISVTRSKYDLCQNILVNRIKRKMKSRWGLRLALKDLKALKFSIVNTTQYEITSKTPNRYIMEYLNYFYKTPLDAFCAVMKQALGDDVYTVTLNKMKLIINISINKQYENTFYIKADDLVILIRTLASEQ